MPRQSLPPVSEGSLLAKIERLEGELRQNGQALDRSLAEQAQLREQLEACILSVQGASKQLVGVDVDLKNKHKKLTCQIGGLVREIISLQCSNETWLNRSINLQFDVLTAKDVTRAAKAHNDLAASKIAQLEKELMDVKAENNALTAHFDSKNLS